MAARAFQDVFSGDLSHCWGCGCNNEYGLQIKSYWADNGEEALCIWQPQPQHTAAWPNVLSGGVIASLMDCHSLSTAMMFAYRGAGRDWEDEPPAFYSTGSLQVRYLKPTPMTQPVTLRARITAAKGSKLMLTCSLWAQDQECARGEVVAVQYQEQPAQP